MGELRSLDSLPDVRAVRQMLRYDPLNGRLFWRPRGAEHFVLPRLHTAWNTSYAGKQAGAVNPVTGYVQLTVCRVRVYAHRVAWALYHDAWPTLHIDHENQNRADNRIANLREVDALGNARNACLRKDNTSGVAGVWWFDERGKWCAEIKLRGRKIYLGLFERFDEAVQARKNAERKLGFHKNHGKLSGEAQ